MRMNEEQQEANNIPLKNKENKKKHNMLRKFTEPVHA